MGGKPFTANKLEKLKKAFEKDPNPDSFAIKQIAAKLSESQKRVVKWFTNRRRKLDQSEKLRPTIVNHEECAIVNAEDDNIPDLDTKDDGLESPQERTKDSIILWEFLICLLNDPIQRYTSYIVWKDYEERVFKIVNPSGLAKLWGSMKNRSINYESLCRYLRSYKNILRKVNGEHCFQFCNEF